MSSLPFFFSRSLQTSGRERENDKHNWDGEKHSGIMGKGKDLQDAYRIQDFPASSTGKESAYHAGDSGLIPGPESSPGEGIGYLLQYSRASLVTQLVNNLPATQETWVQSLGWEDPLEKGKATHSSILAWRIPWAV